jgi:tetratricopeptide (TPR) repeat protein
MRPLVLILVAVLTAVPAAAQTLAQVLASTAPDSLVLPLRRLEGRGGAEAGEAAYTLGQLHYARGEYRQAADAFARASARLEPARKGEARYWAGLAWLGAGDAAQARAILEEVARSDASHRALARLGIAFAWEQQQRPDQALDVLDRLVSEGAGEAGPAALAHLESVARRLGHEDQVKRARERLLREWPNSLEAARLRGVATAAVPVVADEGPMSVQVGAFVDAARARALNDAARRAGFTTSHVVVRRDANGTAHAVVLGEFPDAAAARKAGEKAAGTLGVPYQLVKP